MQAITVTCPQAINTAFTQMNATINSIKIAQTFVSKAMPANAKPTNDNVNAATESFSIAAEMMSSAQIVCAKTASQKEVCAKNLTDSIHFFNLTAASQKDAVMWCRDAKYPLDHCANDLVMVRDGLDKASLLMISALDNCENAAVTASTFLN